MYADQNRVEASHGTTCAELLTAGDGVIGEMERFDKFGC